MDVEIVVIGDELILGTIADTNSQFIARMIKEAGFRVRRVTAVGDDPGRIVAALRESAARSDAVIAAGGLGPTVDDPTREAAADAAGTTLVFHPELWDAIVERFRHLRRTLPENNRKQALLPAGAAALPNPFGTAPGFSMEIGRSILFAVPGVPSEMEAMITRQVLPAIHERFGGGQIVLTRTLHVAGLGESMIDEKIGGWESSANPNVGLMAHAGLTDVRIVARAGDESEARKILAAAEAGIRSALADFIIGADEDTLAGAVLGRLPKDGGLVTAERGTGGALSGMLGLENQAGFRGGLVLGNQSDEKDFERLLQEWRTRHAAECALGLSLSPVEGGFRSEYLLLSGAKEIRKQRIHLVPHAMASRWAANTALIALLDFLRNSGAP
jgi:nicotinamide-nucleotide amidase